MRSALVLLPIPFLAGVVWWGCSDEPESSSPPPTITQGAGCSDTLPNAFPYQPGCCDYTVAVPEVLESGFDGDVAGSAAPDHIHVSWAGPSHTSFAVNWRSAPDVTRTQLLYGTSRDAVEAAEGAGNGVTLIRGHHMTYAGLLDGSDGTRVHETHVCGLTPSTTYFYKVGGPGAWSAVYDTATAPAPAATEAYSFAVLGDSRDDPAVFAEIQRLISQAGVDFQIFTGDLVNLGGLQSDWNAFFESSSSGFAAQDGMARIPMMVTNGNHDALTVNYVAQFAMPQELTEGEAAEGEEWFAFDYGNARFLSLNDSPGQSATGPAQLAWIDGQLKAVDRAATPWVFAFHHRTTYACGGAHESETDVRAAWQPLFDEHQVDIVFAGHNHLYERSLPIRGLDAGGEGMLATAGPENQPVDQSGTLYVVAGGAGAPLYGADGSCPHVHISESIQSYVIVEIDGTTMRYTAYRLDGTILDEFEYTK